jgi:hypothetical protein
MGLQHSMEVGKPISDAQTKGKARIAAIDYVAAGPDVSRTESPLPTAMPATGNPRSIDPLECFDGIGKSGEAFHLPVCLKLMHRRSEGTNARHALL